MTKMQATQAVFLKEMDQLIFFFVLDLYYFRLKFTSIAWLVTILPYLDLCAVQANWQIEFVKDGFFFVCAKCSVTIVI